MSKIVTYKRKSAFADLKDFCVFCMGPENKNKGYCVETTEWYNGEGFDVDMETKSGRRHMQFTWGEWEAIKKCIKEMNKQDQ